MEAPAATVGSGLAGPAERAEPEVPAAVRLSAQEGTVARAAPEGSAREGLAVAVAMAATATAKETGATPAKVETEEMG
jgi:hypothetical protein